MQHYLDGRELEQLVTRDAIDLLYQYDWKGNIRELKNTINYMLLRKKIYEKNQVDIQCLPTEIQQFNLHGRAEVGSSTPTSPQPGANRPLSIGEEHALIDLKKIEEALIRKNKVKKDVAQELGFDNTDNLRYKIKKYYDKYPHLFARFPVIRQSYRRIAK